MNQMIQNPPGAIVGPISVVLGAIIDFIYGIVSSVPGALGISIIIMTIIVRTALLPTAFKMQRNMMKTRAMQPEMAKIREKYGNSKDPEMRRKMSAEMQALQSRHGVNMLASCLPMLITWPLFIALFQVLGQAFMFVGSIGEAYSAISHILMAEGSQFLSDVVGPLVQPYVPVNMVFDMTASVENMNRAIHVLSPENWDIIVSQVAVEQQANLRGLLDQKGSILTFFGLNLVAPAGYLWPGIILPVLSAGTMFLSQFLMMRSNPSTDPQQQNIQRVTMILFPIMFGFFTIQAAAGVGLYWVMLNVYMIVQHYFINRYYVKKDAENQADGKAKA